MASAALTADNDRLISNVLALIQVYGRVRGLAPS